MRKAPNYYAAAAIIIDPWYETNVFGRCNEGIKDKQYSEKNMKFKTENKIYNTNSNDCCNSFSFNIILNFFPLSSKSDY